MIDIHTHVLPGVDDGSQSLDESLAMLKLFQLNGIKTVFCTPHYAPNRGFLNTLESTQEMFDALVKAKEAKGINVDLVLGSEIDESDTLFESLPNVAKMNDSVIMVDFGMRRSDIAGVVYELKVRGFKTIVAHPERYHHLSIDDLHAAKKEGALFQVSAINLTKEGSKASRKRAQYLLKHDMIDFIASDAHHPNYSIDAMQEVYALLSKKVSKDYADKLFSGNQKAFLFK